MDGEDVESVVAAKEVLQLGSVVACDSSADAEDNGSPRRDISGTRRDGYQSSNDAGAEANGGPFAFKTVVDQAPGDASDAGGKVRNDSGHDGAEIGSKSGACIEAEPANPEEDGANHNVSDIVGSVVEFLSAMAPPLSEHVRVAQRSATGCNVDGGSSGEVQATELEDPTRGIPGPAGDGVVDDGGPAEHVDDAGQDPASFGNGTYSERDAAHVISSLSWNVRNSKTYVIQANMP